MTHDRNPGPEQTPAKGSRAWQRLGVALVVVGAGVVVAVYVIPNARSPQALDATLREAIRSCDAEAIRDVIARGADPNRAAPDPQDDFDPFTPRGGSRPMQAYAGCPTPDVLAVLQDAGVDLSPYLQSLAERSMSPARPQVLAWLLQNGLSPQTRWVNAEGWETLCHRVARRGQAGLLRVLLDAGADPDARDSEGLTPLARARQWISSMRAGIAASGTPHPPGSMENDPEQRYADVIAMLQEAGGTE